MSVRERQNEQRSRDRLVAQRFLYRQAKKMENWRLLSVMVLAGALLWGLATDGKVIGYVAPLIVVILWLIDQVFLAPLTVRRKIEAATIQEDFDCYILDLPWPAHLGIERPTQDRVGELAKEGRKLATVNNGLKDWYGDDEIPLEPLQARLHCQKLNCRWDELLRKEWINSIIFVVVVLGVTSLSLAMHFGFLLLDAVLVLVAALRLISWLCTEIQGQSEAKNRMGNLNRFLSSTDYDCPPEPMSLCDVRLVQAMLFEHRRSCPVVPDWFYRLRKRPHEKIETY